ncbi:MAG: TonB family protein [Candidatus Melainabacteria bacterium]|nr:TonB family protein [Candidatus Melainabacteria bacterium]
MNSSINLRLIASVVLVSCSVLALALARSGEASAQAASGLSVEGLRSQIEGRLDGIWSNISPGQGGGAVIDFTIEGTGQLSGLKLFKSSGNESFDHACVGTIKRLVPLPALPPELGVSSMALRATFAAAPAKKVSLGFAPLTSQKSQVPASQPAPPAASSTMAPPAASSPSPPPPEPKPGPVDARLAVKKLNQAVVAINDNNFKTAIALLEESLKLNPDYKLARDNLAVAYNNYGMELKNNPAEAIAMFHRAIALEPANEQTRGNLEKAIKLAGKDPASFKDRVDLGDQAARAGDKVGARFEYEQALAIKDDPRVKAKIQALFAPPPPKEPQQQAPVKTPAPSQPLAQKKPAPLKNPVKNPVKAAVTSAAPAAVNQKLDTVYKHLDELEQRYFKRTFESDDIITRLNRLDVKLFGKPQPGNPRRRLDGLLLMQ